MAGVFLILVVINIVSVVACNRIAKERKSRHITLWTTLAVIFGPLPIPFVLWLNPPSDTRTV